MTRDELLALAARVQAATRADRQALFQLGVNILCAMRRSPLDPNPCLSLDAAASLVPESYAWTVYGGTREEGHATAYCVPNGGRLPWPTWVDDVNAATPALALTAACLRALAQEAANE